MKRIQIVLVFIFLFFSTNAQLLWEISGNGLKNSSYIFATHPYVTINYLSYNSDLIKYFRQTQKVLCEFESGDFDGLKIIQRNAFIQSGKSIISILRGDDFEKVNEFFSQQAGFSLESVAMLKPQYIMSLYHERLARTIPENSDGIFSDAWFQWYAAENNKPVKGLESIETYLNYQTDTSSIETQTECILRTVNNSEAHQADFFRQIAFYKNGEIDSLLYTKHEKANTNYSISDRNQKRVLVIENELKQQSCFITVDAKSLTGEAGLLKKLINQGYLVSPVKLKSK